MKKPFYILIIISSFCFIKCSDQSDDITNNKIRSLNLFHESVETLDLTGIEIIDGPVNIFNTDAKDLSFLQGIKQINGIIDIGNNHELESLDGIGHIKSIKELSLTNNKKLKDLSALKDVSIKEGLSIKQNSLTTISSLNGLTHLGYIYINEPIASLDFLSNLTSANSFSLSNSEVTNLSELNQLNSSENFSFSGNLFLEDYCQLKPILAENNQITWRTIGNRSNPSQNEIIETCN